MYAVAILDARGNCGASSRTSSAAPCTRASGFGITRNGKLAAIVVSVEDLEALEEFELQQDLEAYRRAKADDDGGRVTMAELRRDLRG